MKRERNLNVMKQVCRSTDLSFLTIALVLQNLYTLRDHTYIVIQLRCLQYIRNAACRLWSIHFQVESAYPVASKIK